MLTWQNTGDPCTPETLTFVNHLMPTRIGYTTALGPYAFTSNNTEITVASNTGYSPRGLSYFDASGVQQFIFTLSNKIFRYPNNTDISRAAAYTNGYFSFAQYRDKIYGVNGADLLQKSTTGAFADVASTPKLTRIAVNGEYMAGINLVANYTLASAAVVAASAYRLMISAVGNPEQFDYSVDTTAFTQDIVNTGGPLTALGTLRDMFVVFQKSGVYVVESTGNPADPWVIRLVSDYFGCEWPDSVIEVNNILYWISPTRSGEVCAFDGSQITVLSQALQSTIIAETYTDAGFTATGPNYLNGGLTAATNGETIVWNRVIVTDSTDRLYANTVRTQQLYLNIPTGRFGYSNILPNTSGIFGVFSNAAQNAILSITATQISNGANKFKAAYLAATTSTSSRAEFYRGGNDFYKLSNLSMRFSEYADVNNGIAEGLGQFSIPSTYVRKSGGQYSVLQWTSSKVSGEVVDKPESTALTVPTGALNTTTNEFNLNSVGARSISARTFGFALYVQPTNSLTGVTINYATAGTAQAKATAGVWQ